MAENNLNLDNSSDSNDDELSQQHSVASSSNQSSSHDNQPEQNESDSESLELFDIPEEALNLSSVFRYYQSLPNGILGAVDEGNIERLKELVKTGKSLNINDNHGNTALHIAAFKNNLEMIEYLLSQETLLKNSRNFYGETALFLAVKYKHAEAAKMLLQAGVNVNLPNNEEITPLHKAVNQPELAHLLIKNGAFIDALDYSGESPLHDAVVVHNLEVVCMLLYYNADPNLESENCLTPFMKAIINEDVEIQTALIDYVIDFNARTTEGMTLLALALTHTTPFVEEIIRRGANINYHINNNECFNVVDILCHRVPSTKNFRLVWNKYVHNDPYSSVLTVICESQLSISIFYDYINTIIDSENVTNAVQPFINDLDFLISEMQRIEFPLRYITEVVCVFLSYGKNMCSSSMDRIFSNYNYCELFKIGLHMDINITESFSFLHLLYDPSLTMEDFIKKYITYIEFGLPIHNEPQMLRYCNIPRILEAYVEKDRVPMCLEHLLLGYEEVPRLLDLSRNVTRDYIIKTFNIKTSGDYITTVNSMNLCQPYKKILTYETPLYDFEML